MVPQHAVAGLVVDLARGALDRVEDDVLVEAGDHAVRQFDPVRMRGVEELAGDRVLPLGDVVEPLDADDAERGRELVQPVVHPGPRVVRLAVVDEGAGEVDQAFVGGDEHAALAG